MASDEKRDNFLLSTKLLAWDTMYNCYIKSDRKLASNLYYNKKIFWKWNIFFLYGTTFLWIGMESLYIVNAFGALWQLWGILLTKTRWLIHHPADVTTQIEHANAYTSFQCIVFHQPRHNNLTRLELVVHSQIVNNPLVWHNLEDEKVLERTKSYLSNFSYLLEILPFDLL